LAQNDRMKEWFKKRTNVNGMLFQQMAKLDEILSTELYARDGVCEHTVSKDEYDLDVIKIGCNFDVLWYDRDKLFWVFCPFCGSRIKLIDCEEDENSEK